MKSVTVRPAVALAILLCPCLPAAAQGASPVSHEFTGTITSAPDRIVVSPDGRRVDFFQCDFRGEAPSADFSFSIDEGGRTALLPPPPPALPPAWQRPDKDYPLATLADGRLLTTNAKAAKKNNTNYSDPKRLTNVYLIKPGGGERRTIWEGEVAPINGDMACILTADEKSFIWRNAGRDAWILDLATGVRRPLDGGVADEKIRLHVGGWEAVGKHLMIWWEKDDYPRTTIRLYDLGTGGLVAEKTLAESQRAQLTGDDLLYAFDEKNGRVLRYRITGGGLQDAGAYTLLPTSLPLAIVDQGAGYDYYALSGEKLLVIPERRFSAYREGPYNPAMILYNLKTGRAEKVWPYIMRGAKEKDAVYAAYKPGGTVEKSPEAPRTGVIIAGPGARTSQSSAAQPGEGRYKRGTLFKRQGTLTESTAEFIVLAHNGDDQYTVLKREYVGARNTFFKSDDNTAMYRVDKQTISGYALQSMGHVSGTVEVCPVCSGSGVVNKDVVHTRGGSWEQMSFNIEVYTPYHVIAAWKERAICPRCNHTGLLPR